jgi:acyl-CoA synthetase (AMP-forming)/AMP-acid ligase II
VDTLETLYQTRVQSSPGRPVLVWQEQIWTGRELATAVQRLASTLAGKVQPGQRVGIVAPNVPALIVGLFAAWRLHAVALPINARWREYELRRILQDAQASALISVESHQGYSFVDLLPKVLPDLPTLRTCLVVGSWGNVKAELAGPATTSGEPLESKIGALLYTSGTTGLPRGALVKHSREVVGAQSLNEVLGTRAGEVCLFVIPITHAFGLTCFLAAFAAGCSVVLVESTFSLGPLVNAVKRSGTTLLHGSPALFTGLLKAAPEGLESLRGGLVAGSACPPSVLEQLDERHIRILNLYGMTELGAAACCRLDDPDSIRHQTVGRALPGYLFRIEGGEVQVCGPHVTPGYFRQPEQTAAAFTDGWLRTGDLGTMDARGNLTVSGRAKEVIQVGGLNVFPAEVEAFLLTHPDVVQAAVIGVPHPTMGEVPQAFVVARAGSGLTPSALLQFARMRIAGYKLPYGVRLLPELPLLASGKPDRLALARALQAEEPSTPSS